jgi:fermentation-respiration switch protein FrsA (DUF1100 family)
VRNVLIVAGVVILVLYLYAQLVRRTSMFFPSRYPEGVWKTTAEEVHFTTSDGLRLHGWLYRGGEPLLIWFHGNAGNITERAPTAAELARRGLSILLFDWRGYGRSEGSPSESGLFCDAIAAYDFARTQTKGDIVPYGESLGAPYAAYVAAHRKVRCVVIENSFPSLAAIGNALYRPFPMGIFVPVMHGRCDRVIPFELGMELYNGLRVPKELLVSESAGHCEVPNAEPERYYEAVTRFVRAPAPK